MRATRRNLNVLILSLSAWLLTSPVHARWVEGVGEAVVVHGDYELARRQAHDDALRSAIMQGASHVSSEQQSDQGVMSKDTLSVKAAARVRQSRVTDEQQNGEVIRITVMADIDESPVVAACESGVANDYRKKVGVLGFMVEHPEQLSLGGLETLGEGLGANLAHRLQEQGKLEVLAQSSLQLFSDAQNAPTQASPQRSLTQVMTVAKELGVQFVVSGVVRSTAMRAPETYDSSLWNDMKRGLGLADRYRVFSVDVFVHDGFSGAIVSQQHYQTTGIWDKGPRVNVGFASPEFWNVPYGGQVAALLTQASAELSAHLACQPFMVRITRVDGKNLQFDAGAAAGIRPGDELKVYRSYNTYDSNLIEGTSLTDVRTVARVKHVHPNFSSAQLPVDAARLNIQDDDILIAW